MRILIAMILFGTALPLSAQSPTERKLPTEIPAPRKPPAAAAGKQPALQPLPEPPAPPQGFELDPALEPQVTIQRRGTDTGEEYRLNGRLYMIKVTPSHGRPYYLLDTVGRGNFERYDSYDTGTRPPMWVIHQW